LLEKSTLDAPSCGLVPGSHGADDDDDLFPSTAAIHSSSVTKSADADDVDDDSAVVVDGSEPGFSHDFIISRRLQIQRQRRTEITASLAKDRAQTEQTPNRHCLLAASNQKKKKFDDRRCQKKKCLTRLRKKFFFRRQSLRRDRGPRVSISSHD
jgi:hypothetical protein